MKKFFLKGKELLSKKLEELDLANESMNLVDQQIPNRLKEPLRVLQRTEIDLESNQKYDTYFKNYPNHHLSHFLLQKEQMNLQANTPTPDYQMPADNKEIFIPQSNKELENKALILKEIIDQYDEGYTKIEQPIICMAVIHFHHKRGTEVQYKYPNNKAIEEIQDLVVHHAMPDSSHNKMEDYNFFNFQAPFKNKKNRMLFGVSYFKQIKVTEQMKQKNKEITRSYLQKAIAVVSAVPLFGYLKFRLSITTKAFFSDFSNFEFIDMAYKDMNKNLSETWPNVEMNQLYIGSDLKVIINLFGVQDFYEIWKAVLYQKRVVIYAHSSSSASSFIISLLTLFPGLSTFGIYSKPISKYMQSLREYALPLKLFSSENFMLMSFHIQDFYLLSRFQKSNKGSFLIGTTNRLLKEANDYGIEMLINLQNCTIEKKKARQPWQSLSKKQKQFIYEVDNIINMKKTTGYEGSEDMIRNHFHGFLKTQLVETTHANQLFKKFVKDCDEYDNDKKQGSYNTVKKKEKDYELMEEEDEDQPNQRKKSEEFPPLIPSQVTSIPFPSLLTTSAFGFFLQFHNEKLYPMIHNQIIPCLIIDNYEYYYKINQQEFVLYNWADKKLSFGKGKPKQFEGKQIKFLSNEGGSEHKVKFVYVGMVENNKFSKNGFYFDKSEQYEGEYLNGMKDGYGKLTNPLHKYIGTFKNNLYEGQGQLVTGKDIYVGDFLQGLKHGFGKNQGELNYEGQWINNKPEGKGKITIDDQQFIGTFNKGEIDESQEVTIRHENGSMYKGYIKNKLPEGRGHYVDESGIFKNGLFQNGEFKAAIDQAVDKDQKQVEVVVSKQKDQDEQRQEEIGNQQGWQKMPQDQEPKSEEEK